MSILLGYEIGTGRPIYIPETGHLAWFGQTQLSGKTTALEAIAYRGHLKAVAFITKQGEGGFLTARMIPPYFSEPTNDEEQPLWRWVKSILEASQQRKMNFEESWIIRACEDPKPAKKLADVHENIKALLAGETERIIKPHRGKKAHLNAGKVIYRVIRKPVSGMNAGIYTSLKAYFDIVMPQLARLPYSQKLDLAPGINVMDLREYAMETQALVIRSVMEWVYQKEKNVRVIVPEAQDFVPQGKNSPVKMACENLVRKAGANKNFMWLDSQDMAAVDKFALRACSIVGCGVQTEAHEIDRSLATLFSPALRPVDIARLKIGEFFVRTPEATMTKVYVMPAWLDSEIHAQAIAKGEEPVASAKAMLTAFKQTHKPKAAAMPAAPALEQIQIQEKPENESSNKGISSGQRNPVDGLDLGAPIRAGRDQSPDLAISERDTQSKRKNEKGDKMPEKTHTIADAVRAKFLLAVGERRSDIPELCDLLLAYDNLVESHDALAARIRGSAGAPIAAVDGNGAGPADLETIYRFVKSRAAADPGVLELLTRVPELRVKVERVTIQADGGNLDGAIGLLIKNGFFDVPRDRAAVGAELRRRGALKAKSNLKILSPFLAKLTKHGFLTVDAAGFQAAPDMKINIED